MITSYLILAHKNPEQLSRLIERLDSSNSYFFINIDRNQPLQPFINSIPKKNVLFLNDNKRKSGNWGGTDIVEATIELIREALNVKGKSYLILLSGQDYPLVNNSRIKETLIKNNYDGFVSTFSIPVDGWTNRGLDRLNFYRMSLSNKRYDFVLIPSMWEKSFYNIRVFKSLYAILRRGEKKTLFKILRKRSHPNDIKPFGGSQWWTLSCDLAKQILNFIDDHPAFLKYHQDTLLADEIFFQTIIHHLTALDHTLKIAPSLTYTNWERKNVPLPVTFCAEDFEELKEASKTHLFARKFDIESDTVILDKIDAELLY